MEKIEKHIAVPQEKPVRLSDYVPGIFAAISSKKGMKKAIARGLVTVDGQAAFTSRYINGGEVIELHRVSNDEPLPEVDLKLEVLYEDDHIAIIDKPAGIVVSGNKLKTISNALPSNLKTSEAVDALVRPQPAHRLDFPTSGALLVGKTASSLTDLNRLFEVRAIKKTYLAITIGTMEPTGEIKNKIKDKNAETSFKVLRSIPSPKFKQLNYVELHPTTGRRHQLRIHMAELGHPILGDKTYGLNGMQSQGKGLYLHASEIAFTHPTTKEEIKVSAALPKKFQRLLDNKLNEAED